MATNNKVARKAAHVSNPAKWLAEYESRIYKEVQPTEFSVEYSDNIEYARLVAEEAKKPGFNVEYVHDSIDMAQYHTSLDCLTLEDVRLVIEALRALPPIDGVPGQDKPLEAAFVYQVVRRINIRDTTEPGLPAWCLADFDHDDDWEYRDAPDWLKEMLA